MAPKHEGFKRRILAIERMFLTGQKLTAPKIQSKLRNEWGIIAERRTIYHDIQELTMFLPIESFGRGGTFYYMLINPEDPASWTGSNTEG